MSSKSNTSSYKTAASAASGSEAKTGKTFSRSLREKTLAKMLLQKPQPSTASEEDPIAPADQGSPSLATTEEVQTKIREWEQAELPPRPINSEEEDELSELSESSVCSDFSRKSRTSRKSILFTSKRGIAVEMDVATKVANTTLQKGKEALEKAGNMKRECKLDAIESLQNLYEIVLSLSDSRSRHKYNLEKERSRHAIELVNIERAHNKQIAQLTAEINSLKDSMAATLKETQDVRKWLEFETAEPHRQIKETHRVAPLINNNVQSLTTKLNEELKKTRESIRPTLPQENLKPELTEMKMTIEDLRKTIRRIEEQNVALHKESKEELRKQLQEATAMPTTPQDEKINQQMNSIASKLEEVTATLRRPPTAATSAIDLKAHLEPISERLKIVSSEIKSIRTEKSEAQQQPALSLSTEMALVEMLKNQAKPTSYAAAAKKPPPPPQRKEQHSVVVSSKDSKDTSEKTLKIIRTVLDPKKTGARIDSLKRVKNQKIILSCSKKEDIEFIVSKLKESDQLRQERARQNNPLLIIKNVLSFHTDAEIIEHLKAQNKQVFNGVPEKENSIRVRYRKRARNQQECHVVLEVSPLLHKNFLEVGKVYIDLQRRPIEDQSPLLQCAKCLGFGHTTKICEEERRRCSYCGENTHDWDKCEARKSSKPPTCYNCKTVSKPSAPLDTAHNAFSGECSERHKWDSIARSKISYLC